MISTSRLEQKYTKILAELGKGSAFGELSLLYGKPRMASLKAVEDCHVMVLTKESYNKSLEEIERKRILLKVVDLKNLPCFQHLTTSFLSKIVYYCNYLKVIRGSILIHQGNPMDHVYIVKEG